MARIFFTGSYPFPKESFEKKAPLITQIAKNDSTDSSLSSMNF